MRTMLPTVTVFVSLAALAALTIASDNLLAADNDPSPSDNQAAAKHAKLTACLKEAKARRLVGEQKSVFVKECVAAH
jgi:hypothetical protein